MGSWAGGREVHGRPLEEMKEQIGQSHGGCSEGWVMTEGRQGAWADHLQHKVSMEMPPGELAAGAA